MYDRTRYPTRAPMLFALLAASLMALPAQAAAIGYWRMEDASAGSTASAIASGVNSPVMDGTANGATILFDADVPAAFVYDPLSGGLWSNATSARFNGTSHFAIDDNTNSPPLHEPASFTIETFARIDPSNAQYTAVLSKERSGTSPAWQWDLRGLAGQIGMRYDTQDSPNPGLGQSNEYFTAPTIVTDNTWHHIATTYDASTRTFTMYVDYQPVKSDQINNNGELYYNGRPLRLGTVDGSRPLNARLDEVRYSNTILGPNDFLVALDSDTVNGYWRMEDGQAGQDITTAASEVNNTRMQGTGTGNGDLVFSADTPGSQIYDPLSDQILINTRSMYTAGNSYISVDDDTAMVLHEPASFTIEAFAKVDDTTGNYSEIIQKPRSGGFTWQFDLRGDSDGDGDFDRLAMRVDSQDADGDDGPTAGDGTSNQYSIGSNPEAILTDGLWHHIAATYDEPTRTFTMFVDYEQVGQFTLSDQGVLRYNGSELRLGGEDSTSSLIGNLDEVRLSRLVLGPDQFLRVVPEPSAIALLLLGVFALAIGRRRR